MQKPSSSKIEISIDHRHQSHLTPKGERPRVVRCKNIIPRSARATVTARERQHAHGCRLPLHSFFVYVTVQYKYDSPDTLVLFNAVA